ncbi:MAG: efflux RND transporter permease subunit [Candidatus Omnitrophica bacterium]|nr:efflux RND transporter permease subunit [Candidatus Omnitrophota bacterium]
MTLCEVAIEKKVTTMMVIAGIVLLGLIAVARLPQALYPRVTFPQLTIVTNYLNAAPEEIENLITKPIEESIGSVSGLKGVDSISREGKSMVTVSFDWGVDIDFAALAVREKIDLVKEKLPKEAEDPIVLKFDPLARPVMILSLSGPLSPVDLKLVAEKTLKDNLEKVLGVASADISGGLDREIVVDVDQGRLFATKISLLTVVDAIEKSNISYPAGSIKKGLYEYLIRTMGEFRSVQEIGFAVAGVDKSRQEKRREDVFVERAEFGPRDTIEAMREDSQREMLQKRLILFKDIAEIKDTFKEKTSISRYNGRENISVSIQKQAGANVIQVVDRVKSALRFLEEEISARNVKLEVIYDQSVFIRRALDGVRDAAMQGGILAFIVLLCFLRNFYASFIVIIAIPVTVLGVFFMMFSTGITMNTMSMGGLALGVGMLVDNGVVVTENIFRLMKQENLSPKEAAIKGSNEVIWAMLSSTLTTCAVFFPLLVFVPGVAGQLFKDLSWTVIYSQVLSWFVSLTLTPLLALNIKLKDTNLGESDEAGFKPMKFEKKFLEMPESKQNRLLYQIIGIAVITFFIGMFIMSRLPKEVMPKVDQGQFLIKVNMPVGTKLEITDEVATQIEGAILKIDEVQNTAVSIGSSKGGSSEAGLGSLRASQAQILVNLKQKRKKSSAEVLEYLKDQLQAYSFRDAEIEYILQESEFSFGEGGKPIAIEVKGYDFELLTQYVRTIENKLLQMSRKGVYGIQNDMSKPNPETKVEIDRRKAALYGISVRDVSLTAKTAIDGALASTFKEGGREFDIRVQLRREDRDNLLRLGELMISSPVLESEVPLKEVAQIIRGFGPSEIKRKNQSRTVVVSANLAVEADKQKTLDEVALFLKNTFNDIPEGYSIAISGEALEVKEAFSKIIFALVLSVVLTYMIMASQFESILQPFVIMFTVPLSIIGVSISLALFGTSLNVISLLGLILLGGVVVNNGIVLIEYVNQRRNMGEDILTAAIRTSQIRARPISMTAVSSMMGSLPLALGFGGEGTAIQAPMAVAVIGGLCSSTLLTLFVIPAIYILIERFTGRFLEKFYGADEDEDLSGLENPAS